MDSIIGHGGVGRSSSPPRGDVGIYEMRFILRWYFSIIFGLFAILWIFTILCDLSSVDPER